MCRLTKKDNIFTCCFKSYISTIKFPDNYIPFTGTFPGFGFIATRHSPGLHRPGNFKFQFQNPESVQTLPVGSRASTRTAWWCGDQSLSSFQNTIQSAPNRNPVYLGTDTLVHIQVPQHFQKLLTSIVSIVPNSMYPAPGYQPREFHQYCKTGIVCVPFISRILQPWRLFKNNGSRIDILAAIY